MKARSRRRTLIPSKVEYGTIFGGGCSVCHRPFEVVVGGTESLSQAHERLLRAFNEHVCDEDANQAAARIVRETTE